MSKITGIYKITSPTGRIYIGQSVDVLDRWRCHKNIYNKNKTKLYYSFMKHTPSKHKFKLIERCSKSALNEREQYYIEKYDTFETEHGLNLTSGGDSNVVLSKETRAKISKARKGKPSTRKNFKHTDETKEYLRMIATGNTHWLGKTHTDESKDKIRKYRIGSITSSKTRIKITESLIGKKRANSTSKYYGVSFNAKDRVWTSFIKNATVRTYIGCSKREEDAAKMYDAYVLKHINYDVPINFESSRRYKQLALF